MDAPIRMRHPERRGRRASMPMLPMQVVDEVAYRFLLFHSIHGGRLDQPEAELRARIGDFLMAEAGPIRANSRGRREVFRGVRRLLAGTERAAPGETAPRATTSAGAPDTDT